MLENCHVFFKSATGCIYFTDLYSIGYLSDLFKLGDLQKRKSAKNFHTLKAQKATT